MLPAIARLVEQTQEALSAQTALCIQGGNSKSWYGPNPTGEPISTTSLNGIRSYEPSELVVTVLAGTPLQELEDALAQCGQCLAFEPPRFNASTTVGGMVATGLSGPARLSQGGMRDFVLGATLLSGKGELMSFGGQVIKNVAGYDVSRLLVGSMGVLGMMVEVSLKVLPVLPATATLHFGCTQADAIVRMNQWGGQALPIHASTWWNGTLVVRMSGARAAVDSAIKQFVQQGAELIDPARATAFWLGLRDQQDEFFVLAGKAQQDLGASLWRLSVPQASPPLSLLGEPMLEWGGALRWLSSDLPDSEIRTAARRAGGHATRYRAENRTGAVFEPLPEPLMRIHRDLKKAFDPHCVFNPGRLYADL